MRAVRKSLAANRVLNHLAVCDLKTIHSLLKNHEELYYFFQYSGHFKMDMFCLFLHQVQFTLENIEKRDPSLHPGKL